MSDLELLQTKSRDPMADWALRGGVALFYVVFGAEKFSSSVDSHWVLLFHQIHAGEWFRYLTAVIEIGAAVLVLIPRVAWVGLLLLAGVMLSAALIVTFVLRQPGEATFPALLSAVLVAITWGRTHRDAEMIANDR